MDGRRNERKMVVPSKGKGLLLVTSSHHCDGLVRLPLGGLASLQLLLSLCSSPEGSHDIEKAQGRKQRDTQHAWEGATVSTRGIDADFTSLFTAAETKVREGLSM